jgi:hypothetical protein
MELLNKMKEMLTNIWVWFTVTFIIIDFFIIAFLFSIILVILLSPLVVLIGLPLLMGSIWKKKY